MKTTLKFKRRRQGITNYTRRLRLLLSKKPRFVVRRTLKHVIAQIAEYDGKGDKIVVSVHSSSLRKYGWNHSKSNLPASYLTGLLLGVKAKEKGVKEAIADIGLINSIRGNSVYAALKGVIDAGVNIPANAEIFPKEERISGKHIADFAAKLKSNQEAFQKNFSQSLKDGANPEKITEDFMKVKNAIIGGQK